MSKAEQFKKANTLEEVDNAVRFDVPIPAGHNFYTDFSDVRGDFEEKMLYKALNVNPRDFSYNEKLNEGNRTLLFLSGMRGSGKTSELTRIAKNLHHPKGFFCVTCNLDEGLDINDMQYMDILIFQLERLFEELQRNAVHFDQKIIESLQNWFSQRIKEANKSIKQGGGIEVEIKAETPSLLSFLKIAGKVKANIQGSKENAEKIRTVLRTNFTDFASEINLFFAKVNTVLRRENKGRELLFVVDGLEKAATAEIRKKIVIDESNRLRQIEANTIFTLPIELRNQEQKLLAFSTVVSFPFIKLKEKNGDLIEKAIERFKEFTFKRIDAELFESEEIVRQAILAGGGSPREYLRILGYINMHTDEELGKIDQNALDKAIKKLAVQTAQFLTKDELDILNTLATNNAKGIPTPYSEEWQDLLEKLVVMEYNDGSYKRVNPLVEASDIYQYYVRNQ